MGARLPYSDAELAAIGKWLVDGLSASQIAAAFSHRFRRTVSRNAIIGIVSRNRDLAAIGFAGRPRGGRKAGGARNPGTRNPGIPATGAAERRAAAPTRPGAAGHPPVDAARAPCPPAAPEPPAAAMSFLEAIFADRCLFFAGRWDEPAGPNMAVCGAPRALAPAGTRWCPYHQGRMTAAASPGAIRRPVLAQWGA